MSKNTTHTVPVLQLFPLLYLVAVLATSAAALGQSNNDAITEADGR
jgi:hypothetical protein